MSCVRELQFILKIELTRHFHSYRVDVFFFFFEKEGDKLSFNLFKSRSSEKTFLIFQTLKHINCGIIKTGLIDTANYYDISLVRLTKPVLFRSINVRFGQNYMFMHTETNISLL